jgi:hypothetical protein
VALAGDAALVAVQRIGVTSQQIGGGSDPELTQISGDGGTDVGDGLRLPSSGAGQNRLLQSRSIFRRRSPGKDWSFSRWSLGLLPSKFIKLPSEMLRKHLGCLDQCLQVRFVAWPRLER